MKYRSFLLSLAASVLAIPVMADQPMAPYAGQQMRSIKALSDDDVAGLLKGDGMGFAKAAELNGYPGPKHVLDLGDQLKLTAQQRQQIQVIFDKMSAVAKPLGAELVERERVLDQQFRKGEITPDRLASETATKGDLQGGCERFIYRHILKHGLCCAQSRSLSTSSFAATETLPRR